MGGGELGRWRDLLHATEDGVVDFDDHLVVDRLGLVEHLARMQVLDRAHVGGEERVDPVPARLRREDRGNFVLDDDSLLRREREPHVEAGLARRDAVVEPEHLHEPAEPTDRAGVNPEVLAVAALERARDDPHPARSRRAGRERLLHRGGRLVALAPQHRVVRERAVEQRRLHVPAVPVFRAAKQRPEDADDREVRRADARERETLEDRPVTVCRLRAHRAHECMHQRFVTRHVAVRTVGTEPGDRAIDQPGGALVQRRVAETEIVGSTRLPALHEHVGVVRSLEELLALRRISGVEHQGALPAGEHRRCRRRARSTPVATRRFHPGHVRAVVGEDPGRARTSGTHRTIEDSRPGERTGHLLLHYSDISSARPMVSPRSRAYSARAHTPAR